MKTVKGVALLILGITLYALFLPLPAQAAGVVGTGSPASCDNNDLAQALMGGGLVTFECGNEAHTINSDTYFIQADTTILGKNRIILNGESLRQHFIIDSGATLNLHDIILINGESSQGGCISVNINGGLRTVGVTFRACHNSSTSLGGGAVYNLGTFDALDTIFESNRAEEEGGALLNRGIFTGTQVVFEANQAADDSGAIENDGDGIAVIVDAAFIGNTAAKAGGAVGNTLSFPQTAGSVTIHRTLFIDNSATTIGGAINNVLGNIHIENSTFYRNTAKQGGAIYASGTTLTAIRFSTFDDNRADTGSTIYRPLTGVVTLGYSILAGGRNQANTTDALLCDGPSLGSTGYNLIEDGTCVDGSIATDIRNTTANLGAYQYNGGFTSTLLPGVGSPALDVVPAAECVPRDQRFALRLGNCDIGAAERGGLFESAFLPRVHR